MVRYGIHGVDRGDRVYKRDPSCGGWESSEGSNGKSEGLQGADGCHSANYMEAFSSFYLDVLLGSNSVTVRFKGSGPAK